MFFSLIKMFTDLIEMFTDSIKKYVKRTHMGAYMRHFPRYPLCCCSLRGLPSWAWFYSLICLKALVKATIPSWKTLIIPKSKELSIRHPGAYSILTLRMNVQSTECSIRFLAGYLYMKYWVTFKQCLEKTVSFRWTHRRFLGLVLQHNVLM